MVCLAGIISTRVRKHNRDRYYDCLQVCDVEGAMEYGNKIGNVFEAERMKQFLSLYNAGDWPRTFKPDKFLWMESWNARNAEMEETARAKSKEWDELIQTEYDEKKLKNWNGDALEAYCGVRDIYDFTPADPRPRHYIVVAEDVVDPRTNQISEGGQYSKENLFLYERSWLPADTDDLLRKGSCIENSALILTDDPDKAEYALILDMNYTDRTGSFSFDAAHVIPVYFSALTAEIFNLTAKESLVSETVYDGPYVIQNNNQYIYTDVMEKARTGGALYGGVRPPETDSFEDYWSFIGLGEEYETVISLQEKTK